MSSTYHRVLCAMTVWAILWCTRQDYDSLLGLFVLAMHSRLERYLLSIIACSGLYGAVMGLTTAVLGVKGDSGDMFWFIFCQDLFMVFAVTIGRDRDCIMPFGLMRCSRSVVVGIEAAIIEFSVRLTVPSAADHVRVFTVQLVALVAQFAGVCWNVRAYLWDDDMVALVCGCVLLGHFIMSVSRMVCHFLFILDRRNFGMSLKTVRWSAMTRASAGLADMLLMLPAIPTFNLGAGVWGKLLMVIFVCATACEMFFDIKGAMDVSDHVITELPTATPADLEGDNPCIVCRSPMEAEGSVKVLPCGHCCHVECLERWLGRQSNCPLCREDLSFLRGEERPVDDDEEEQEEELFFEV